MDVGEKSIARSSPQAKSFFNRQHPSPEVLNKVRKVVGAGDWCRDETLLCEELDVGAESIAGGEPQSVSPRKLNLFLILVLTTAGTGLVVVMVVIRVVFLMGYDDLLRVVGRDSSGRVRIVSPS